MLPPLLITTLTGGDVSEMNSTVIVVNLTINDVNQLKSILTLATEIDNTFITVGYAAVSDMNGNAIREVNISDAVQATAVIGDDTSPILSGATLNLSDNTLTLTFSESVNVMSLMANQITLQNTSSSPTAMYSLSGGILPATNTHLVTITLIDTDADNIKANPNLATSLSNTFIAFPANFVLDGNNNGIGAVLQSAAMPVILVPDTASPTLESFDFLLENICQSTSSIGPPFL